MAIVPNSGDSLDNLCDGSIKERDSRILPENGFINICWTRNPMDWIHEQEEKGKKPKEPWATRKSKSSSFAVARLSLQSGFCLPPRNCG